MTFLRKSCKQGPEKMQHHNVTIFKLEYSAEQHTAVDMIPESDVSSVSRLSYAPEHG